MSADRHTDKQIDRSADCSTWRLSLWGKIINGYRFGFVFFGLLFIVWIKVEINLRSRNMNVTQGLLKERRIVYLAVATV